MHGNAYLAGRRDDFQPLAFSSCFGMVRRAGCTLTRVAALGSVVAWCCPSEVFWPGRAPAHRTRGGAAVGRSRVRVDGVHSLDLVEVVRYTPPGHPSDKPAREEDGAS